MSKFLIYHNPRCSKSRQALKIIQDHNCEYTIKLYLEETLTIKEIEDVLLKLKMEPRALLRIGEEDYKSNNLNNLELSDQDVINFMIKFPKLIERPIIIKGIDAVLGRPPENVNNLI